METHPEFFLPSRCKFFRNPFDVMLLRESTVPFVGESLVGSRHLMLLESSF
jgi:hypothetical protein